MLGESACGTGILVEREFNVALEKLEPTGKLNAEKKNAEHHRRGRPQ